LPESTDLTATCASGVSALVLLKVTVFWRIQKFVFVRLVGGRRQKGCFFFIEGNSSG
jgi:hypothetical protein